MLLAKTRTLRPQRSRLPGRLVAAGLGHGRRACIALLLFLLPPGAAADDLYRVRFNESLQRVFVHACFDGRVPRTLYRHRSAGAFASAVRAGERTIRPAHDSTRVRLSSLADDACVSWDVDLKAALQQSDYRSSLQLEDGFITPGNLWFWRDGQRRPIVVEVELPADFSLSVPWQELPSHNGRQRFRPEPTPASWTSRIAVGGFEIHRIPVAGTTLRLALVGEMSPRQRDKLSRWIEVTGQSVASVFGEFPRNEPQILVVASGRQSRAVPWAHVVRGGGIAAELFVDPRYSARELADDWTATHELSHMLLPYVSRNDRWLSEGVASYYQNVLRARDGRLSEREAWQKLHSGFERGRAATGNGTLAEAMREGWSATMRIYWSGAAMMLEADARLRLLSQGEQSLDTALAALHRCCFDPGRRWRAAELFARLDQLTGHSVFSDLYRNHVLTEGFPDIDPIYHQLGLQADSGSVRINPQAPWSRIRHFIMNEPAAATGKADGGGGNKQATDSSGTGR